MIGASRCAQRPRRYRVQISTQHCVLINDSPIVILNRSTACKQGRRKEFCNGGGGRFKC